MAAFCIGLVDTKLLDCRPFAWMAAAEFSLGSNSAVISSLKWNSGHSHFSATGQITDFRHPHLLGSYDGQVDLTEAASIARRRDLRAGVLELKGHGDWSLDQFATNGLLTLRDLDWKDDQISSPEPPSTPITRSPTSNSNSPNCKGRFSAEASPVMLN